MNHVTSDETTSEPPARSHLSPAPSPAAIVAITVSIARGAMDILMATMAARDLHSLFLNTLPLELAEQKIMPSPSARLILLVIFLHYIMSNGER